ncbi:hypothetical protein B5798_13795 [Gilliamella apicola]|uniref:Flp family type IVb pilin n=1 Tax=Gilliamella apicola TaxID=1196095 RepID=UPI0009FEC42E|nr:Flp family type IVb pilin [Gilliamella apicola]ORF51039.1 hypothetical protein B5798_13795 [Gilliamella apicola]
MMYLSAVQAQLKYLASKFIKNELGVTAIEYAIVAAGVSAVVLVIFKGAQGSPVYDMFVNVFRTLKYKLVATVD